MGQGPSGGTEDLPCIAPATSLAVSLQSTVQTAQFGNAPNPLTTLLSSTPDGQETEASSEQEADLLNQAADVLALGCIPAALQSCTLVQAACYRQHLGHLLQPVNALVPQCLKDVVLIRPAGSTTCLTASR